MEIQYTEIVRGREKFIAFNVHIKKEIFQTSNLTLYLKKLEKRRAS